MYTYIYCIYLAKFSYLEFSKFMSLWTLHSFLKVKVTLSVSCFIDVFPRLKNTKLLHETYMRQD